MSLLDDFCYLVSDVAESAIDTAITGIETAGGVVANVGDNVVDGICDTVDYVEENPWKTLLIAAATVSTGGAALAAAPAIGATVSAAGFGVAGGTLSGAAASSAGLAALGGGSLAAGGAGMAGGTAVVTATGAVTGSTIGMVATR